LVLVLDLTEKAAKKRRQSNMMRGGFQMGLFAGLASLAALSLFFAQVLRRSSALMPLLSVAVAKLYFTLAGGV
jgi:hypothetical protein